MFPKQRRAAQAQQKQPSAAASEQQAASVESGPLPADLAWQGCKVPEHRLKSLGSGGIGVQGFRLTGEAVSISFRSAQQPRSKPQTYGELSRRTLQKLCTAAGIRAPQGATAAELAQLLIAADNAEAVKTAAAPAAPEALPQSESEPQPVGTAAAPTAAVDEHPAEMPAAASAVAAAAAVDQQQETGQEGVAQAELQADVVPASRLRSLGFQGLLDLGRQLDPPVHATSSNSFVEQLCSRGLTYSELPLATLELLCAKAGIQSAVDSSKGRHLQLVCLLVDADGSMESGAGAAVLGIQVPEIQVPPDSALGGQSWQSCAVPEARLWRLGLGGLWELGRHLTPPVHSVTISNFVSELCSRRVTYSQLPLHTLQAMCSKSGLHPPSGSSSAQLAELLVAGDAQLQLAGVAGIMEAGSRAAEEAAVAPATPSPLLATAPSAQLQEADP